jgi:hypothetical protein
MYLKTRNAGAVARSGVRNQLDGNYSAANVTPPDSAYKRGEIETTLKRCIIDAFSADRLSQEIAIRLIRAFSLGAA